MSLFKNYMSIVSEWRTVFCKTSTFITSLLHSISSLQVKHRKTITTIIRQLGQEQENWNPHYRLYSRSTWNPQDLFEPIICKAASLSSQNYIQAVADYTEIKKTGKCIPQTGWIRDPMSPKFRHNLIWGQTFLQTTFTIPLYHNYGLPARSIPIGWYLMPRIKKPSKKASEKDLIFYRKWKEKNNKSKIFIRKVWMLRQQLDNFGYRNKKILYSLDAGFCNRHVFRSNCERVEFLSRARKNIKLCFKDNTSSRRFYRQEKFTPEQIRKDKTIEWKQASIFHGGKWRDVGYKEVNKLHWQGGALKRALRLIVIRPVPYRKTKKGRLLYRQPAYLLCTGLEIDTPFLIQSYFDRWEIEVNHKDEKYILGIGQAQVRNERSVEAFPVHAVASYSALLLALILSKEEEDEENYIRRTKWYTSQRRASCQDLSAELIKGLQKHPELLWECCRLKKTA